MSELQRAKGTQTRVGVGGDGTFADTVDVGYHGVAVDDNGNVCPFARLEGVPQHHTVARGGVPTGIELPAVVGMEEEGAPAWSKLVHVAAVEV